MDAPTCEQLWESHCEDEEDFVEVHSKADPVVILNTEPSWRHGCYMSDVFRRKADDTYWMVQYRRSGDGEYNGFREGEAEIYQCWPVTKTVTDYVLKKPE